jgi:hypothetical protein
MNPHYPFVAQRAAHYCEYCGAPEAVFNFPFELEHVHPRARGGSDEHENLALACRSCNLHKADAVDGRDPVETKTAPLFNPRRNIWGEHFSVQADGIILGKTAVGRATIERLRMNSSVQVEARQQWLKLKLFPRS